MKKILLSAVAVLAMGMSFSASAALEPINGSDVYLTQGGLSPTVDVVGQDIVVLANQQAVDHVAKAVDARMMQVSNSAVTHGNAQTLMDALPKVGADGRLRIDLKGSSISYQTINMGMGDFTKMPNIREAPTINR